MTFIAKAPKDPLPIIEPGSYLARCDLIADLGMQDGGVYKASHQCYLRWSLHSEDADKPSRAIGIFHTVSLHPKGRLRPFIEQWRGSALTKADLESFDLFTMLGKWATLHIEHRERNGVTRAVVQGIRPGSPPKDDRSFISKLFRRRRKDPPTVGFSPVVSIVDGVETDSREVFETLPEWLQAKIAEAVK